MAFLLVVDDDPTIRENLCELFEHEHVCEAAKTAEEAFEMLGTAHFDVVLTDIMMPGMSGLELIKLIRIRQPETPIIVISGTRDEAHIAGANRLGVFKYLRKPYKLEEVEACVASAIEYRERLLEARRGQAAPDLAPRPKMYVWSLGAVNAKPDSLTSAHEPGVVIALSEGEARGKGFERAREKWPEGEGWTAHRVAIMEVDRDIISQAASLILSEGP